VLVTGTEYPAKLNLKLKTRRLSDSAADWQLVEAPWPLSVWERHEVISGCPAYQCPASAGVAGGPQLPAQTAACQCVAVAALSSGSGSESESVTDS
jgi:hypothetical protein